MSSHKLNLKEVETLNSGCLDLLPATSGVFAFAWDLKNVSPAHAEKLNSELRMNNFRQPT